MASKFDSSDSVVSIVVTYFPDPGGLKNLLAELSHQTDTVITVDNSNDQNTLAMIAECIPGNGILIDQKENSGIAAAINCGIRQAQKQNAGYVVLFDQDSLPGPGMIQTLHSELQRHAQSGDKIAAVGPKYSDIKGELKSPFVRLDGRKLSRIECADDEVVQVDHLISSGCLISMAALQDIGEMEEELFIDYVDTEWCLRAINKGYSLYGVGAAQMQHSLGDQLTTLFGRSHPVRGSLRYYYLIRNGIWVLRRPWISRSWRNMDRRRLFLIYIGCSLFIGSRFANWKMMTIGIWHSMTGRMGKYQ